jgi:hypothetical protein
MPVQICQAFNHHSAAAAAAAAALRLLPLPQPLPLPFHHDVKNRFVSLP